MDGLIVVLQDGLQEKDKLINSLLEQLSKCNNKVKISQKSSKSNTKSFKKITKIKLKKQQQQLIRTTKNRLGQMKHHVKQ